MPLAYLESRRCQMGELKEFQGAIADYDKLIKINPRNSNAYSNRGLAKSNLQDYQGAIADYDKAIEINSQNTVSYLNRGIAREIAK